MEITYIIPLLAWDDEISEACRRCLDSLNEKNVVVVSTDEIYGHVCKLANVSHVKIGADCSFWEAVNKAAFECMTAYFSVVDFTDIYEGNTRKSVETFISERPGKTVYMPFGVIENDKGEAVSFVNELGWNPVLVGENLGEITRDALGYHGFIYPFALINTDRFLALHGFKQSMKAAAWQEFLLRVANHGEGIYVVPKVGFHHRIGDKFSNEALFADELKEGEATWLSGIVDEESRYDDDRKLKYEAK